MERITPLQQGVRNEGIPRQQTKALVKDWRRFPASLRTGEDRAQARLVCAADTEKILLHLFLPGERSCCLPYAKSIFSCP